MNTSFEEIRLQVTNELPDDSPPVFTGIIGDRPSQYAKTPSLWNAVYRELGWDAVSMAWDLPSDRLTAFLDAARASDALLGFSVTVPFKSAIVPLLDGLDDLAAAIGAVNTVVRDSEGRLVGYNTDGQGAIDALTSSLPGRTEGFVESLEGLSVLILGAGGAARAVAFFVASKLGHDGRLWIVNRDESTARDLAGAIANVYGVGAHGAEADIPTLLGEADLVINASSKGQAGWRVGSGGEAFQLEPYSALAPANPWRHPVGTALDSRAAHRWFVNSMDDIEENARLGRHAITALKPGSSCFDLIYSPIETRFLADARISGHPTMNGKWMNIAQAADAFATKVCTPELRARGITPSEAYAKTFETMARVW